jgi:hypothetical protein
MPGAISLPSDEENGGFKQSFNQARNWFDKKWNGDQSEAAPLLNRERGTVEPPRRTNFRIITTIAALVLALIALGVTVGLWFNKYYDGDNRTGKALTSKIVLFLCINTKSIPSSSATSYKPRKTHY